MSVFLIAAIAAISFAFNRKATNTYTEHYTTGLERLNKREQQLTQIIGTSDVSNKADVEKIRIAIHETRLVMKGMDFWLRYLEPTEYKKVYGPLPVEWETEAFEKFEKPYKRIGAGLTLAELYLEEPTVRKDSLQKLVTEAIKANDTYDADSITTQLFDYNHFFLCNRLFLLNLAAIYTTGFECPDASRTIPELKYMFHAVDSIYRDFNASYTQTPLTTEYRSLYNKCIQYTDAQPDDYAAFDHYTFIRDFINPLFKLNQEMIARYHVISHSMVDYALNKKTIGIFNKGLYNAQDPKGIFHRVTDTAALTELNNIGKMLFYDPILSGNNLRSCASCHKPAQYFTDTVTGFAQQFDRSGPLPRNTPTLINAEYNHLLMLDGKHTSLLNQCKGVITSAVEMNCKEDDVVKKVMSCKEYASVFKDLLKYTPEEKEVTLDHIASAVTYYYCKFSEGYAPFDNAMNRVEDVSIDTRKGFNIFMSKAQCGTCHFVPLFNGVKPPYVSSEFEVLGVPADRKFSRMSADKGRYEVNPADETANAFRTGTIRNAAYTKPYMHNGVFTKMEEVIDFYDAGGGTGHGLKLANQTLSSDSLKLTKEEKRCLIAFIGSLNENIQFDTEPKELPKSKNKNLNTRKPVGEY